jgi:RHH-type transcriptional regulator, proline utilization regulon repressor / proline dehydrogenase / delta 1-pyrroline-5-carboxylate dehydrogenase
MQVHAQAIEAVRRWLAAPDVVAPAPEMRLARLLAAREGAQFVIELIDGVFRPVDAKVVAGNLEWLAHTVPSSTGRGTRFDAQVSAGLASVAAGATVPVVRDRFLRLLSHLLLRLDVRGLDEYSAELAGRGGIRPTLVPVSVPASGQREANRQAAQLRDVLLRDGVDSVSFRLSTVVGNWRPLNLEGIVDEAVERLAPLYGAAARADSPTFLDLEVGRSDELEPSLQVFEQMLQRYPSLDIGIALPDTLPDSLSALRRIVEAVHARREHGGARATVRIVRGDDVTDERSRAELHDWAPAAFENRGSSDAHFLRMLDFVLRPARTNSVRVISATHDLFVTAYAWRLARSRGVERHLEHEFRLGIASQSVDALKREVGGVRLAAPVMQAGQLALAASYLARRVTELSDPEGVLALPLAPADDTVFQRERTRFLSALEDSRQPAAMTNRRQNTVRTEVADLSNPTTREWAFGVLERSRDSAAGESLLARSLIQDSAQLESLISHATAAGQAWGSRRGSTRATVLDSVAEVLAEWRGLLVEVAVSESGLLLEEADGEVSEAIIFAHSAALNARELDSLTGVTYLPPRVVVVVSPRSCPIAALAGQVLPGLASGAAIIVKTAPETRRSSAVFVETLIAGGVPPELLSIVDSEGAIAQELLSSERVDRVTHTGSRHAAKHFHSWRAEMPLFSTTGGRNSFIVTPSADLEAAVSDIVQSAFSHAGQSPRSIGTVILVGSVGESARFLGRLSDAVASIATGWPGTPAAGIAALARPAGERELEQLGALPAGATWLVTPRQLDREGRLFSPGLRDGVQPESLIRRQERRSPVLDLVRVSTLAEAIHIQNAAGFGLSAGIHTLDEGEASTWLAETSAGVLCINRAVTELIGAPVPLGGWNRSVLGVGGAAGGQDAALLLGSWEPVASRAGSTVTLDGVGDVVARFISAAQPALNFTDFDWVRTAARSDEIAWRTVYRTADLSTSEFERTVRRYRDLPVTIRLSEGAPISALVRVLAAAAITAAPVAVSSATPLHPSLIAIFGEQDSPVDVAEVLVESDTRWRARVQAGEIATTRIRLIGGDATVLARVLHQQPGIAIHAAPVTTSGRIELCTFLREQAICVRQKQADWDALTLRNLVID